MTDNWKTCLQEGPCIFPESGHEESGSNNLPYSGEPLAPGR